MAQRGNPEKGGEASLHSKKVKRGLNFNLHFKGINYRANKLNIMDMCKIKRALKIIWTISLGLPDRDYNSPVIVEEEFSKRKKEEM